MTCDPMRVVHTTNVHTRGPENIRVAKLGGIFPHCLHIGDVVTIFLERPVAAEIVRQLDAAFAPTVEDYRRWRRTEEPL
jgi:hypothetical protein